RPKRANPDARPAVGRSGPGRKGLRADPGGHPLLRPPGGTIIIFITPRFSTLNPPSTPEGSHDVGEARLPGGRPLHGSHHVRLPPVDVALRGPRFRQPGPSLPNARAGANPRFRRGRRFSAVELQLPEL